VQGKKQHILVIRAGALGDLVFCFRSFAEIRKKHPDAEIALLTRAPFADFAHAMPWFDRIIVDTHPSGTQPAAWTELIGEIKNFAPDRVYDLQGKNRQTIIYALLGGPWGPEWSGAAPKCKFPRPWPPKPNMHFTDFLAAQLRAAGVPAAPPPDLSWLDAPVEKFALPENYVVLIPGCSPHAPYKRWPPENYVALVRNLQTRDLPCVVVGSWADAENVIDIEAHVPVINLCGKTSLFELAGVLRHARAVVGNDTGPLHMAAALGMPTLALFSGKSNPDWSKPLGKNSAWLQRRLLTSLGADHVISSFNILLDHTESKSR
jgi:ADP-heptose:LPS heptosyltransferase